MTLSFSVRSRFFPVAFFVFFILFNILGFCLNNYAEATTLVPLHIKKGTNLIAIARDYCKNRSDWKAIAQFNNLKPPYLIFQNMTLQIPLSLLKVEQFSAKVGLTRGTVQLMQGKKLIGPIQKNDTILPGQTILTGSNSYVQIILPNQKYTRLAPDSKLTVNYLIRLTDGQPKIELYLQKGRLVHTIKQKLKDNESFQTKTPVSITGVRGTVFRLKMLDSDTNVTETLSGKVQLQAEGQLIGLKKNQGSKTIKDQPPSPPRALPDSPEPLQLAPVYKSLPAVVSAPQQATVQSIHLRLTRDRQGEETLLDKVTDPGTDFTFSTLADGSYFCFLTAIDHEGFESLPVGPFPLTIRTTPAPPLVTAPKNDLTTWEKKIAVTWDPSTNADHYMIELATDARFSRLVARTQSVTTSYRTPELEPGVYYARVQTVAADGFGSLFSPPVTWTIAEPVTIPPVKGSLKEGLELQWTAVKNATYELQIGLEGDFDTPVISQTGLTTPAYTIQSALDPGQYHIRMRYTLPSGQTSPWSPPQIVSIDREPFTLAHGLVILSFLIIALL